MKKKQRGYINITGWDMLFICCIIGLIGWGVIESLVWLLSHITIGWV